MFKRVGAIFCLIVFVLSFLGGLNVCANNNSTTVEDVEVANVVGSALMIVLMAVVTICLLAVIIYVIGGLFL